VRAVTFSWPLFLLALLLLPLVLAYAIWQDRRRARYAVAYTNLDVLASVAPKRRSLLRWVPLVLLLLALAAATAALARPKANRWVPDENATVVLLVDTSGSMRARDVEPTRLDAATAAMRAFLDRLPSRFHVGLVEFSSVPEVLAEPTRDHQAVRDAIGYLSPDAGTAIGDGLDVATRLAQGTLARERVRPNRQGRLPAAIVLLSDGSQNRGVLRPLEAARKARRAGIRVYTVALGTPKGVVRFGFGPFGETVPVPPDAPTMRAIASATGGASFTAKSAQRLESVYQKLGSSIGRRRERKEISSWFLGGAALLLLGALGAGRALAPRVGAG
jgi:Ca-activated chloride channel family protein